MWRGLSEGQGHCSPNDEGNIRTKFGTFCRQVRDVPENGQYTI